MQERTMDSVLFMDVNLTILFVYLFFTETLALVIETNLSVRMLNEHYYTKAEDWNIAAMKRKLLELV